MLRATLRSLLARKLRLILSALAVVLGVAFVSGTFVLTDTINSSFDNLFQRVDAGVDVVVQGPKAFSTNDDSVDRPPVPDSVLALVGAVPGVSEVAPDVNGTASVVGSDGRIVKNGGAPQLGTNWTIADQISAATIRQGHPPGPGEVVVDQATFDKAGIPTGGSVRVVTQHGAEQFRLAGVFTVAGSASIGGATFVAFDTVTAQRLLLKPGYLSDVKAHAVGGVSQSTLAERVRRAVGASYDVETGKQLTAASTQQLQRFLSGFTTFLLVFAGVAIFVGAFIISNTFTVLVAQRAREMALLRAVGATRGQVLRSVLLEAAAVGVIGSTLGLGLGLLLAVGLKALVSAIGGTLPAAGLAFLPRTVIVAYVVGILVTTAAALVPARKASRVPPVAALRETFAAPTRRGLRRRALIGLGITAVGVALLAGGLTGSGSAALPAVGAGAALTFIGVATLSPIVCGPVTRLLGLPIAAIFGIVGRLGRDNTLRDPRRTSATAAALMVGLALVSTVTVLGASIKASTRDIVTRSLGADFILTASGSGGHGGGGGGISPAVEEALRGKPGIGTVAALRIGAAKVDGSTTVVGAFDPTAVGEVLTLTTDQGNVTALKEGRIIVDATTAKRKGYHIGSPIPVVFAETGQQSLQLVGTFKKNQLVDGYVISLATYDATYTQKSDQVILVAAAAGADAALLRMTIDAATGPFPNVTVQDQSQFIADTENQVQQLVNFVYVLLALSLVIALVGVVNTLALSVVERTREIGLLRAVGMGRRQLRRMIRLEALVIAVYGALLGLAVGAMFGVALQSALADQGLTKLAVPVGQLLAFVVVAGLAGIAAAVAPAFRASRLKVLDAIAST